MELLVRWSRGPDDVVVDPPVLDRVEDRVTRLAIAPFAPADDHRALRVRVGSSHLCEERAARFLAESLTREDECERLAGRLEFREVSPCPVGRPHADHAIVALVPVDELSLDGAESHRIGIDGKDDRRAHRPLIVVRARLRA
jgi:hypothetical protein